MGVCTIRTSNEKKKVMSWVSVFVPSKLSPGAPGY